MAQKSVNFGRYSADEIRNLIDGFSLQIEKIIINSKSQDPRFPALFGYDFVNHNSRIAVGATNGTGQPRMVQRYADVPDALQPCFAHMSAQLTHLETDSLAYRMFGNRILIYLDDEFVFKIAFNNVGRAENKREHAIWQAASPDLRVVLNRVIASATDGAWLVMPFSGIVGDSHLQVEVDNDMVDEVRDLGLVSACDLKDTKLWGKSDSFPVLTTYCL